VHDRLYRSRSDRMIFGVAGGMAEWLDVDPSVVRLVWALLIVAGGIGLILYIVAAIVVPEEPLETGIASGPIGDAGAAGSTEPAPPGAAAQTRWEAREARRAARRARYGSGGAGTGAIVFGLILVIAGAWFLLQRVVPGLDNGLLWPALLIIVGGILVASAMGRSRGA
jgi:phage shock protein C